MVEQLIEPLDKARELKKIRNAKNKALSVVLGVLGCIIIVLVVGVVVVIKNNEAETPLIDTEGMLLNYTYDEISDPTKAFILSVNIQGKLESDEGYGVEQALAEYKEVYEKATGDLKVYVGMEYAIYLYEETGDLARAEEIMNLGEYLNGYNELDYYVMMLKLYTLAGDEEQIDKYEQIVNEKTPVINLNVEEEYEE